MPNDKNQPRSNPQQGQGNQKSGPGQPGGGQKQSTPKHDQGGMNQPNQTDTPKKKIDDEDDDT